MSAIPITTSATSAVLDVTAAPPAFSFSLFTRYFRVVQSSSALVFHSIALYIMLKITKRLLKTDVSVMLKTFLIVWLIEDLLAIPYGVFITFWWRPVYIDYYSRVSFLVVLWERSFSCTIPVAVFFLTLDRSLTLLLGLGYRHRHARVVCLVCVTCIVGACSMSLYIYLLPELLTDEQKVARDATACHSTVCFFDRSDDWQFLIRVTFGTLNFVCSTLFFFLLREQNRKRDAATYEKSSKSRGNTFVIYAISSEIVLNFLPHATCLLYEVLAENNISGTFGTYSRFVTALDALVCAVMYRRIKKPAGQSTTVNSVAPSITLHTARNHAAPTKSSLKRSEKSSKTVRFSLTRVD